MKKIVVLLMMVNMMFANQYLDSIYENIVVKNANELVQESEQLEKIITSKDKIEASKSLKELIYKWKKVQAFYILGELNGDFIDTPRYIDFFHHGNEDINTQLDLIVKSEDAPNIALFKNSFKSINALEYILTKYDISNERIKALTLVMIQNLKNHFLDIKKGYIEVKNEFIKDEKRANAMMLNALIETSYKLKEWRIGDVAGLSRKYKGQSDIKRGEYFISNNSLYAIEAILQTNQEIMGKVAFKNYGSLIESYGIKEELFDVREVLNNAIKEANRLNEVDLAKAKKLFLETKKLYINYYITLISKLKITAKVLDADGD